MVRFFILKKIFTQQNCCRLTRVTLQLITDFKKQVISYYSAFLNIRCLQNDQQQLSFCKAVE